MQNDLTGGGMGAAPAVGPGQQADPAAPIAAPDLQTPGGNLAAANPAAVAPAQVQSGKSLPSIDQFKEMHRKQSLVDLELQGILRQKGPISRKDVINMAVSIVKGRLMSSTEMAQYLSDLPEEPFAIREWLQRHAMEVEQHLDLMAGVMHGSEQIRPLGEPEPPTPEPSQDLPAAPEKPVDPNLGAMPQMPKLPAMPAVPGNQLLQ